MTLSIAHIDCDSFFAAVEKRDNPDLAHKPLIIGGGQRGVVSTACYIARMYGVRSAMPIYKAKRLCPDAVFLKPSGNKYAKAGKQVRALMEELTPLVQPVSIDEAFLDMTGTDRMHGAPPAVTLAKLIRRIEDEVGITASVGLSHNKFLAKLGSDMEKPRGFSVIGVEDTLEKLAPLPISKIMGIGKVSQRTLEKDGLTHISQIQQMDEHTLIRRYGENGQRLYRLARGIDSRQVKKSSKAKSVSTERTMDKDIWDYDTLEAILFKECDRVAAELKRKDLAGTTITLKLKTQTHKILTRSHTLDAPTQLAHVIFERAQQLLRAEINGTRYRLIGIGISNFRPVSEADQPDLIEPKRNKKNSAERAMDALKGKFGEDSIQLGRKL